MSNGNTCFRTCPVHEPAAMIYDLAVHQTKYSADALTSSMDHISTMSRLVWPRNLDACGTLCGDLLRLNADACRTFSKSLDLFSFQTRERTSGLLPAAPQKAEARKTASPAKKTKPDPREKSKGGAAKTGKTVKASPRAKKTP